MSRAHGAASYQSGVIIFTCKWLGPTPITPLYKGLILLLGIKHSPQQM